MSRFKNFSRNLATSYVQLVVNVVYSLVSVPLILHWLPKAEFGLWLVLVQLMSYISLVDLGINQAISRFLVDHKDQRGEGKYGALVKTSALVSVVQGLIVLIVVTIGSPLLAELMNINADYTPTFIKLMRWQGLIAAFTFCANPLAIMLNAHQRMDIVSRQSVYNMVTSLGLLFIFLIEGLGIYAFIYANAIAFLCLPVYYIWHCQKLRFLPQSGEWGRISWRLFQEVFLYGKDVFLMNVGIQLVAASQTIVVTRTLGLETAAVWSVGTKVFMLMRQVMYQPVSAALAGLSEMLARKEFERLKSRFRNLVVLTASLGVFLGTAFALCNSLFVQVWMGSKIAWSPLNDLLLGSWIFIASVQTTHGSLVFVTKQIGWLPYVFIFEGCTYVVLSDVLGYRWGLPGIIACSLLCLLVFSCQFCLRQSGRYFGLSFSTLVVVWLRPSLKLATVLLPVALVAWFSTSAMPVVLRLAFHAAVALLGGVLFLHFGLSSDILDDMGKRLPRPAARLMGMLGPAPLRSKP